MVLRGVVFIERDLPLNEESLFRSDYRLKKSSRPSWIFIHNVQKKMKPRETRGSEVKTVSLNTKGNKGTKE